MTKTQLAVISSLGLAVFAAASVAAAGPNHPSGHHVAKRHEFRSPWITNGERRIIAKGRRRVVRMRQHAFQDGYVTRREAKKLKKAKRRLRNTIYWARHNDKVRKHPRDRWRQRYDQQDNRHRNDRFPSWWW